MHILQGFCFGWLVLCCSAEMARLYNTRNAVGTITSSTLAWVSPGIDGNMPENAVPVGTGGPFWCRSFHHGIWVSGAVIGGSCHAPFLGKVEEENQFQVLVSVNGSARLINVPWDNLVALPLNPVSTPNMLLALRNDAEVGAVLPGYVDPKERRAHFLQGNISLKLTGGYLITEDEPIAYNLRDVELDGKTKMTFHDEVLQEFKLENPSEYPKEVSKEVTFISPHKTYFGNVKGTIVGLPASVRGRDTMPVNITWGLNNQLDKERSHVVSYNLPAGTKVNVQIIAAVRVIDGGYGGTLTSYYNDGEAIDRRIGSLHMERRLAKLRAEFSQVRNIVDESPVGTLTAKTMILLHSSTTTAPTPTELLFPDHSENQILPRPQQVGVNDASATYGSSFTGPFGVLLILLSYYLM